MGKFYLYVFREIHCNTKKQPKLVIAPHCTSVGFQASDKGVASYILKHFPFTQPEPHAPRMQVTADPQKVHNQI